MSDNAVQKPKKRVSISLAPDEARFLYQLIEATGNDGPLWWTEEREAEEDQPCPYALNHRKAFWRLKDMVSWALPDDHPNAS